MILGEDKQSNKKDENGLCDSSIVAVSETAEKAAVSLIIKILFLFL